MNKLDLSGFSPARGFFHFIFDSLTWIKTLQSGSAKDCPVEKYVGSALIGDNESESPTSVKPAYGASPNRSS